MATIEVTTHLRAPEEKIRAHIKTSKLLRYVNAGLLSFLPLEPPELPELWSEGQYRVRPMLFGIIPLGWQMIAIENPEPDEDWVVRDNGSGSVARVWDHLIYARPDGNGTAYTDHVTVEAGLLTPFVALFAHLQYRYRQYRWRRLISNGFDYSA